MPFDFSTDSWAKGDPIPMASDAPPLAQAEASLAQATAPSDLNGFQTVNGRLYVGPTQAASTTTGMPAGDPATVQGAFGQAPGSSGQATFNQYMNAATSLLTGKPTTMANTGGQGVAGGVAATVLNFINNWLPRIFIIILGFIFIAAGLRMFGQSSGVVREVVAGGRAVKGVALPR
jgi:hypothetical protein